jgi:hypothetical protein
VVLGKTRMKVLDDLARLHVIATTALSRRKAAAALGNPALAVARRDADAPGRRTALATSS